MEKVSKKQASKASSSSPASPSLSTISKKTPRGKQVNVLTKFNEIGAFKLLNLSSMEKNYPYKITHLKKANSKFGERLLAELNNEARLFLPERYNTFNDKQIAEIANGAYTLINKGKQGDMFNLELIKTQKNQAKTTNTNKRERSQIPEEDGMTAVPVPAAVAPNLTEANLDDSVDYDVNEDDEDEDFQYSQAFPTDMKYYSPL